MNRFNLASWWQGRRRVPNTTLWTDAAAGLTVAMVLVPQAMAYAHLAGLPAVYGLYAACIPLWVGSLFGSCPQLSTGPVAMTSLLVYSVLSDTTSAELGSVPFAEKAILLAFLSGAVLLTITSLRLTAVFNFISHPVMVGFTNAGALVILFSQVDALLGLQLARSRFFLLDVFKLTGDWSNIRPAAAAFGLLAFLIVLLTRRRRPRWPAFLFAVLGTLAFSAITRYETVLQGRVVGEIPRGLPPLTWPLRHWRLIPALLPGAVVVAIIGFMEVMAVTRAVAIKTRRKFDLDREMLGQGLARVAGSFTGAFPVSGSFSRTALNLIAGAQTRFANLTAGLIVLLTLLFLTPLLRPLPHAVLSVIIILAVIPLMRFRTMLHIWRANRQDGISAWVTFGATLLLAPKIVEGVLIGACLAVALFLYRTMKPHAALLARHPDGTFRDAHRHRLDLDDEILLFRFDGPLYFANVENFEQALAAALESHPHARGILLVGDGITEIDASGEEMLRRLAETFAENNIRLAFAEIKWKVMDVLERSGLADVIGRRHFFRTAEAGFQTLKREPPLPKTESTDRMATRP